MVQRHHWLDRALVDSTLKRSERSGALYWRRRSSTSSPSYPNDGGTKGLTESGESGGHVDALSLHRMGHEDMIDNLLYASTKANGLRLLTLDELSSLVESVQF